MSEGREELQRCHDVSEGRGVFFRTVNMCGLIVVLEGFLLLINAPTLHSFGSKSYRLWSHTDIKMSTHIHMCLKLIHKFTGNPSPPS